MRQYGISKARVALFAVLIGVILFSIGTTMGQAAGGGRGRGRRGG